MPPEAFAPIVVPALPTSAPAAVATRAPVPSQGPPARIVDFAGSEPSPAPRPAVEQDARAQVIVAPTPRPVPDAASGAAGAGASHRVGGVASWYCMAGVSSCHYAHSGGLYAAAGPKLRVGDWRGRRVRVCANGRCVTVTLIDWCGCYGKRVIDLYSDAFKRLAPTSAGVVKVTVSW